MTAGSISNVPSAIDGTSETDAANSASPPTTVTRGIATFDAVPTGLQVTALSSLGLEVQPMQHVPLALVEGTHQSGRQYGRNTSVTFPGDGAQNVRMEPVTANRAPSHVTSTSPSSPTRRARTSRDRPSIETR